MAPDKKTPPDALADAQDDSALLKRALLKFLEEGQKNQFTPDALNAVLEKVGMSTALGMQKAVRPENDQHPGVSAFFTSEDKAKYGQKPKLKRDVYFNFHKENEEQLTPSEIDAYNSLDDDCDARNGQYAAVIKQRGRKREELHITIPVRHLDHRMNAPQSIWLMVHELKTGQQVSDMQDLFGEIAELKARLAQYEGDTRAATRQKSSPGLVGGGPLVSDLESALDQTPVSVLANR